MIRVLSVAIAIGIGLVLSSCSADAPAQLAVTATPDPPSGERLAYLVGCVNCHHQTPKEIFNAPSLVIVQAYSLPEFTALLRIGLTRDGRDMYAQGSTMGIVAREQFSRFTEEEIAAVHEFLQEGWTAERAASEEEKMALFPPPTFKKG
jgi:cytochrome c553